MDELPVREQDDSDVLDERRQIVEEALKNCSQLEREIFQLMSTGKLTQQEIAEHLGLSKRTVQEYWYRVRDEILETAARRQNVN